MESNGGNMEHELKVENPLEDLVRQITSFASSTSNSKKKKSKQLTVLIKTLDNAIVNFAEVGMAIAKENPKMESEMKDAIEEVLQTGINTLEASKTFANDTGREMARQNMIDSSRNLLNA